MIILSRAFRVAGGPSVVPPGTPKDRVAILQEAFRKTYKDPEFLREYKKFTGDEASPSSPKTMKRRSRKFLASLRSSSCTRKLPAPSPAAAVRKKETQPWQ